MFNYVIDESKININAKKGSGNHSAQKSGMIGIPNCIVVMNPLA